MTICVAGLWHLGSVTAACLADAGHMVTGLADDQAAADALAAGHPPVHEPGLADLLRAGREAGRLRFTADAAASAEAEIVWLAWDTPVDEEDRADVAWVESRAARLWPYVAEGALVIVSSQLPVGTTARLEAACRAASPRRGVAFACLPENLRLGEALDAFRRPDRVVAGIREAASRPALTALLKPFTDRVEWMGVESAEMTKHALNAFLAASVVFANEIAAICEVVGADAKEVERGLKSEGRIGPRAYLGPGAAFSGGTLARDLAYLDALGGADGVPPRMLIAARESNRLHRLWPDRALAALLGTIRGRTIAVWGLAYKPGTDTLRRSEAVALCARLVAAGAGVRAHDPGVRDRPAAIPAGVMLCATPEEALAGADALVVATPWPDYRAIGAEAIKRAMGAPVPVIIDAGRFLAPLAADLRFRYAAVGRPGNNA